MNAVCLYVTAAKVVLQNDNYHPNNNQQYNNHHNTVNVKRLEELNSLLPQLRTQFSCSICLRLLCDPYSPRDNRCHHNVCRLCVRGRKQIRPPCTKCENLQDFKAYNENRSMRCLLFCYKSLCEHVKSSPFFSQLSAQKVCQVAVAGAMSPQDIIIEGAKYDEVPSQYTPDLQKTMCPTKFLPAIPQVTVPQQPSAMVSVPMPQLTPVSNSSSGLHAVPKAATPPVIKQEILSPPQPLPTMATILKPTHPSQQQQAQKPTQLTVKHLKNLVELTPLHARASTSSGIFMGNATLPAGVVVPIVSSSATTTAPLTIASARLQNLNRQLIQARNAAAAQVKSSTISTATINTNVSTTTTMGTCTTSAASVIKTKQGIQQKPVTFKVALSYTSTPTSNTSTLTNTTAQSRQPPPIKTVSNGSAMYSVLYTGVGNKITIKRKTDNEDDSSQKKNTPIVCNTSEPHSSVTINVDSSGLPPPLTPTYRPTTNLAKPAVPKRRGCRCGNATATPGKLTCCGQRCPCYVDSKSCVGCKCRGCRNPHRPDGGKVRPIIPELACYEIEMADESDSTDTTATSTISHSSLSPKDKIHSPNTSGHLIAQRQTPQNSPHGILSPMLVQSTDTISQVISTSSTAFTTASTSSATLIPLRHSIHTQQQQQQQQLRSPLSPTIPLQQPQKELYHQQQQQQHQQQTIQITQTSTQPNMLSLENLQRESVLIQNNDGKYQVVNLFTQPRLHALSHHQLSAIRNMNSATVSTNNTVNSTFLLPQMVTTNPTVNSNFSQIIMQQQPTSQHQQQQTPQQQQQHHHTLPTHRLNTTISTTQNTNNTIALHQLQQHLNQHPNIITVHPITTPSSTASALSSSTSSSPMVTPTSTLSPIIVHTPTPTPPSTTSFQTDCESLGTAGVAGGGAGVNIPTPAIQLPHQHHQIITIPMDQQIASSTHNNNNNNNNQTVTFNSGNNALNDSESAVTMMDIIDTGEIIN